EVLTTYCSIIGKLISGQDISLLHVKALNLQSSQSSALNHKSITLSYHCVATPQQCHSTVMPKHRPTKKPKQQPL
ncbi:MAG: hypothetical protein OSJ42_07805, partial [Bacteroidales bacterium]|nr:hypothetical protein [Bacteroidales bacterium]